MVKRRNAEGRFTPEHTDGEVLAAVRTHEPAATSEVADELGITRQGADRRLRQLREDGRVNSKQIGKSLVWFSPDAEPRRESEDAALHGREAPASGTDDPSPPSTDAPRETASTPPEDAERILDEFADDLPGSGSSLEARKDVILSLYDVVRERGKVRSGELKELVDLDGTGYGSVDSFWINVVTKPTTNPLAALPGVEAPGHGGQIWRYAGEPEDTDGDAAIPTTGGTYDPTEEF